MKQALILNTDSAINSEESAQSFITDTSAIPLCVDLDGTLIKTDLLLESFLVLVKTNPLYIFMCCLWLLRGKANLKAEIAQRVSLDVSLLPYNQTITHYLHEQHSYGRQLYLCTASNQLFARQVAKHMGFFSGVFASDEQLNLSNRNKAHVLKDKFGKAGFDYIGNSQDDIAVWKEARNAIVVGSPRLASAAAKANPNSIFFEQSNFSFKKTLKAMRVYQWVKNVLIFVPLLTSHQFTAAPPVITSLIAFASFSFCASSVYLLNDMLDLDADRRHARKRNRPFAAGELPLAFGIALMLVLLAISISLAVLLPAKFILVITSYYVLTLAYSFKLKKMVLIDVFALASLYTSRVMAGGVAAAISLSSWLIMFSITIFLSLAFVKRYSELDEKLRAGGTTAVGRGYLTDDLGMLRSFGTSAGYLAVIILAIYMNSPDINLLYSHRSALWGVFTLLLFWVSWMWMSAYQGKMHDDPIVFALRDRTSLLTISALVMCMLVAI